MYKLPDYLKEKQKKKVTWHILADEKNVL